MKFGFWKDTLRFPQANAFLSHPTCAVVVWKEKLCFVSQFAAVIFPFSLIFLSLNFLMVTSQRSLRAGVEEGFEERERNVKGCNYCLFSKICCAVEYVLMSLQILG